LGPPPKNGGSGTGSIVDEGSNSFDPEYKIYLFMTDYIISLSEFNDKRDVTCYFIKIGKSDPFKKFIQHYEGRTPPILAESSAKTLVDKGISIDSEGRWFHINFEITEWISNTEVKVSWGKHETSWGDGIVESHNATCNYAILAKDDEGWKFKSNKTYFMAH